MRSSTLNFTTGNKPSSHLKRNNNMQRSNLTLAVLILSVLSLAACSQTAGTSIPGIPTAAATSLPQPAVAITQAPTPTEALVEPAGPTSTAPVSPEPSATQTTGSAQVTSFPNPDLFTWIEVASGLTAPTSLAHAGDERLFIVERDGRIRILQAGSLKPEPFLDITDRVGAGGERGLLGLAFHPRYPETGAFYVNYTDFNGNTHISQFSVTANNPDQADAASEKELIFVEQPFPNHNGGALAFGPDGFLYIGLGDGGSAGDPHGNGQSVDTLLGKILRISVDQGDPYGIPDGNPFISGGGRPEIWAYGLRNPWRFAFDSLTGDFYIGDVGQNIHEEIDFQPASSQGGENYGWNILEGSACFISEPCDSAGLTAPVFTYTHAEGGCSVTGGGVYRGSELPEWQGIYLFGDYCSGMVGGLLPPANQGDGAGWQRAWLFTDVGSISSFGEDASGEIYLADLGGSIYRLVRK
ncbi:MAG TPA: PQQ-dependent sugar dehydrogenase [Anaerolineales bacterium]|nr:PQQ-dependent sugar dehydrogenase [Anaerolineales bacterium]